MTISEVSKKFGLSADTLRYYERIGLIPHVPRSQSGLRDYDEESCNWIEFIKCMRSAGLPIEILIEYVTMFRQGDSTISARKELLIEQRDILRQRISDMQSTLDRLDYKINLYESGMMKQCENKLFKK
jgi:DNA-binding transcriptional MerR regulator